MEAVATQVEKAFAPERATFSGEPAWLAALRRDAWGRFEATGFPSAKDEAWRYTGLQPITETAWRRVVRPPRLAKPLPEGARFFSPSEVEGRLDDPVDPALEPMDDPDDRSVPGLPSA